jgi:oligopeptidase B
VARLRATKTDETLLLLKTHLEAGHGGASGRFDSLKDDALAYAFALMIAVQQTSIAALKDKSAR